MQGFPRPTSGGVVELLVRHGVSVGLFSFDFDDLVLPGSTTTTAPNAGSVGAPIYTRQPGPAASSHD